MPDFPNAFEHQRFLVRTPSGMRTTRSFRELVTATADDGARLPDDEPLALDYPQEYLNVAALGLLAFLAQAAFAPDTPAALAGHLRAPLSPGTYEAKVGPLRAHFLVDGPAPRFMQGRPPTDAEAATWTKPVEVALPTVRAGEARFLNRPGAAWAVGPEQAALLLFARNTFYEGTAGRGYQKGVNGDTPVRTMLTDAAEGDAVRLRRSLWLNVLTGAEQRRTPGRYAAPGDAGAYAGWFWETPPAADIPLGAITLPAALGWMSANHWLLFEDEAEAPRVCVVTGAPVTGRAAARVVKWSTGIGYGQRSTKDDEGGGQNAERLFHHPHVPLERLRDKKTGDLVGRRAYHADRARGLAEAVGASFFGAPGSEGYVEPAPVVRQLADGALRAEVAAPRLVVFGFHMLSAQKNVHGGFELDTFRFRLPDPDGAASTADRMRAAAGLFHEATRYADRVAYELNRTVQIASGVGVRAAEDEDGRTKIERFEARKTSDGRGFAGDAVARFWRAVQRGEPDVAAPHAAGLHDLVDALARVPGDDEALRDERARLLADWEASVRAWARAAFDDAVDGYRTAPRTLPLVPLAERMLLAAMRAASFNPPEKPARNPTPPARASAAVPASPDPQTTLFP